MRLGITMRVVENSTYPERRDALSQDWSIYVASIFPEAVLIPVLNFPDRVEVFLSALYLDGIILSNGNDWGGAVERDETEQRIVAYCLKMGIPVLGVCRGLQVLNLCFGGKLESNLRDLGKENHIGIEHDVNISSCPYIDEEDQESVRVNSFHNQGVLKSGIASSMRIFAVSKDGIVEGFYHPDKPILAIQWHPERLGPSVEFNKKMITNLFCL